jgi:hypothetical protein
MKLTGSGPCSGCEPLDEIPHTARIRHVLDLERPGLERAVAEHATRERLIERDDAERAEHHGRRPSSHHAVDEEHLFGRDDDACPVPAHDCGECDRRGDREDDGPGHGNGPGKRQQEDPVGGEPDSAPERTGQDDAVAPCVEADALLGPDSHANRFGKPPAIPLRRTFGYRRTVERLDLRRNWPAALLALAAVVLIPWAIALGQMLPSRHVADHWDAAWTGFDVILAASLLTTAYAALRRRDLVRGLAAVSGTLLLCDAWFDLLTSSTGTDLEIAILLAVLGELPLALVCFLLAIGTTGSLTRANARLVVRRFRLL